MLMNRLKEYLYTSDNQFGFKKKHGTDMCIYVLKELVSRYRDRYIHYVNYTRMCMHMHNNVLQLDRLVL